VSETPSPDPGNEPGQRRDGPDRRMRPTAMMSKYLLLGRRRGSRRVAEGLYSYVDRPGGWMLTAFACIVGLSLLDAWYTLDLLKRGATEANPVMKLALEVSDGAFVVIKTVITILGAGFLCLHKNWPLGRVCLVVALIGYSILLGYHLYAQFTV
jgi:hypothetical protein